MTEEDYGQLTDQQQEQIALALAYLRPEQLAKVACVILEVLENRYGMKVTRHVAKLKVVR